MMSLHHAIIALYPNVAYIHDGIAYDENHTLVDYDKEQVESYINANLYKEQRAKAYPSIEEQLDTLYHQGYDGWKATIEAVKLEFPKP